MSDLNERRAGLSESKRALLEQRLRGTARAPAADAERAIPSAGPGPVYPASFAQERLWVHTMMDPGNPLYNVPVAATVSASLDVAVFERAVTEVVRRHETLRTVFRAEDGALKQVVLPAAPVPVEVIDVRDRVRSQEDVEALVREEAARPLDLERGPVFRVSLLRVSDERYAQVVTVHHVSADGWAYAVILREIAELYEVFRAGRPSPLPEPRVRYADFAVWQRAQLQGDKLRALLDFWRGLLEGAPDTELPTDRPRPAQASFRGAAHRFTVPAGIADGLRRLGREEAATLNMLCMAALAVVLRAYTGQDDVVIGSVFGNRTRRELEDVVGLTVNTAALRVRMERAPGFRELVRRVKRVLLDADRHQDLPFEKLVDELNVPRDPSRHPLFQVMYFHHTLAPTNRGGGGAVPELAPEPVFGGGGMGMVETGTARFDLTLTTIDLGGELGGFMEYAADLFEPATIERLARHWTNVLAAAVADPDRSIAGLSLLDPAERGQVAQWSAGETREARSEALHRLFEAAVDRHPDAPAILSGGRTLTYAELDARASRIAAALRAAGIGAESRVAVAVERSPEMVAALLGVTKAGGAFVPIDPAYPAERRRHMLDDSAAAAVLTRRELADEFAGRPVLFLEEMGDAPAERVSTDVDRDGAAYLIYTSGSTGVPKGVLVSHRGIGNLAAAQGRAFGVGAGTPVLQFASLSFDAAVAEIAHTLLNGGVLVIPTEAEALPGPPLLRLLRDARVRVATLPPAVLDALPDADLPDLETLVTAGEAVSAPTVARWGARRMANAYGPTETTVCATVALDVRGEARPPVGRPLANTRAYVLDDALRMLPPGVPGELYVAGLGLARGYHGRPAATAERFLPDPHGGVPGARMYRTGDRARWRGDGSLEFLGRADDQVKVRGYRIELGEIESVLLAHPAVAAAVAAVREDAPGDVRLVAYVVPAAGAPADPGAELRAHLRDRLPDYMAPSAFVPLDAIPLTPSGKVDRRALPRPEAAAEAGGEQVAPRTVVEEMVAEMWSEVLGRETVGVTSDFFALGGHSLLATQVVSRLRARLGLELSVRIMFDVRTVASLAERIEALRASPARPMEAPIPRLSRDTQEHPLSFAQQRLWFLEQLEPGRASYNVPFPLRLRGVLDTEVLRGALAELVRRHEPLRTVFLSREGE
ncbi:MAG TPA: amino acid adenylation domain-containing protein, partial [Longimicrobium sp.]|nr:amino acid adenylation domain-containing protein [Longimicrobium sp.]